MSYWSQRWNQEGEALVLEARAERARLALACTYSNSAEYDAALIAARRAAGVYGPKRQRRQILTAVAGVAAGLTVLLLAVHLFV